MSVPTVVDSNILLLIEYKYNMFIMDTLRSKLYLNYIEDQQNSRLLKVKLVSLNI